jgi:hypothetical protein
MRACGHLRNQRYRCGFGLQVQRVEIVNH